MLFIAVAVVVLIGVALGAAIVLGRSPQDDAVVVSDQDQGPAGTVIAAGDAELGTVTVDGTSLPGYDGSSPDPGVGLVPPTLTGQDFAGHPVTISDDGRPKMVMFLAHWCPHCRREVPKVQSWLDANGMPADVALYAVPTATSEGRDNYPPSKWLLGQDWTVPVLVDDAAASAASSWGLQSYPYFVAVGADGAVVKRASGELSQGQFYALVDAARTAGN
ncbi:MAG: TlpA family protein disulfide reductase [Acidimicrobiales bacterium]